MGTLFGSSGYIDVLSGDLVQHAHSSVAESRMTPSYPLVFLIDVDNTLVDNDRIQRDLKDHLEDTYGRTARERYWRILEDLFAELGYRDYLGALQRYRAEHPREVELLAMSSFLINYPFADRLFPGALKVLKRLGQLGLTVILSDGDVVFQPHKVERAGLADTVDGRVLIYIHKEEALDDVERRYSAEHYVLVDDKLRILAAVKQFWGERVTTVFVRQGAYAHDPTVVGAFPRADVTIERIGDLVDYDLPRAWLGSRVLPSSVESAP
jgi:FMN phosphatase YigB (HAD superfamily)